MAPNHDFFVSYNGKDKAWAEWIAWTLEEDGGYSVLIQAWDFRPGQNFILQMQKAAVETERTLIVLSPNYLAAEYTQPEWAAAFVQDPSGASRKLIPIRVEPCQPDGMLRAVIYADLVGLAHDDAKAVILAALPDRAKPSSAPTFPGGVRGFPVDAPMAPRRSVPPSFPGSDSAGTDTGSRWRDQLAFLEEHRAVATDDDQKRALETQILQTRRRLRDLR